MSQETLRQFPVGTQPTPIDELRNFMTAVDVDVYMQQAADGRRPNYQSVGRAFKNVLARLVDGDPAESAELRAELPGMTARVTEAAKKPAELDPDRLGAAALTFIRRANKQLRAARRPSENELQRYAYLHRPNWISRLCAGAALRDTRKYLTVTMFGAK